MWFPVRLQSSNTGLVNSEGRRKKSAGGAQRCHIRTWLALVSLLSDISWLSCGGDKVASEGVGIDVERKCICHDVQGEHGCISRSSWILQRDLSGASRSLISKSSPSTSIHRLPAALQQTRRLYLLHLLPHHSPTQEDKTPCVRLRSYLSCCPVRRWRFSWILIGGNPSILLCSSSFFLLFIPRELRF